MALKGPICSELPILKLRLSYEKKEEGEEKVSDSLVTHGISGQKKKKKKKINLLPSISSGSSQKRKLTVHRTG